MIVLFVTFFSGIGNFTTTYSFPVFTQLVQGLTPLDAGLSFNQVNELYQKPGIQEEKFNTELARDYFTLLKVEKVKGKEELFGPRS